MSAQSPTLLELLLACMTRSEIKLVFLLDTLAESEDYGPHLRDGLRRYATPGEDPSLQVEGFRRVIRYLVGDFDFWFQALSPDHDGVILGTPIEPENAPVYYGMLARGQCPDLIDACRHALALLEERAPRFDRELIRAAKADFERNAAAVRPPEPEIVKKMDEFADAALASIGVVRHGGIVN